MSQHQPDHAIVVRNVLKAVKIAIQPLFQKRQNHHRPQFHAAMAASQVAIPILSQMRVQQTQSDADLLETPEKVTDSAKNPL